MILHRHWPTLDTTPFASSLALQGWRSVSSTRIVEQRGRESAPEGLDPEDGFSQPRRRGCRVRVAGPVIGSAETRAGGAAPAW